MFFNFNFTLDEVSAIVVDIGTCTTKAGYAGEDSPKSVFPSVCLLSQITTAISHLFIKHVGTLYTTGGQDNVIGAGVKAVGDEGDVPMSEAGATHGNDKNVQYFVGTNALHYRRPFMEIENPLEDGLGTY